MKANIFDFSPYYRRQLLKANLLRFNKRAINGKSLACLFLTRFCSVGCSFCFFKSPPAWKSASREDQFDDIGIDKFIQFSKEANLGYILISGGGEPMNRKEHVLKIIEKATADRIVLATSGSWAKNYENAKKYIDDIYEAISRRIHKIHVVIRVSVSEYHAVKLGTGCAENVIKILQTFYHDKCEYISCQIKSFTGDGALKTVLSNINASVNYNAHAVFESDNEVLEKKIPYKVIATLPREYKIVIGISRIFNSSAKPNLNDIESIKNTLTTSEEDLHFSENYNSTIVYNTNATEGIDWSIGYNGNICTWQNQSQDHYLNIYDNDYEQIMRSYMSDPLTYSVIEKGNPYRDAIISEVNQKAVLRAKAMGLRDCVGLILFEEEKTRLYYTLRVLQDYINENRILKTSIQNLSNELKQVLLSPKDTIIAEYERSTSNIISQIVNKKFCAKRLLDLLELIKLGHYHIDNNSIDHAIMRYNSSAEDTKYISSLAEVPLVEDDANAMISMLQRIVKNKDQSIWGDPLS